MMSRSFDAVVQACNMAAGQLQLGQWLQLGRAAEVNSMPLLVLDAGAAIPQANVSLHSTSSM